MDCADIRQGFASGVIPEGPAVAEHVRACPHCRELFEQGAMLGLRFAQAPLPPPDPGDLFSAVQRDLQGEVGLHARLRALPSWARATALVAIGGLLFALHLFLDVRPDLDEYGLDVFGAVTLLLGAGLVWGAWRLVRGVSRPARREGTLALALLALPMLVTFVVPLGALYDDPVSTWGNPADCFSYGAALVLPMVALAWLFERRDRIPAAALVSAGALAGVAANLLLNAHCASVHLGHLMLGHASIGIAWALGLLLVSRLVRAKE
ncbi:MAG TPA: NrsF family protein [Polyangiaceae bacterium]|nr:NrsF family protein [Polyangiaceae bacterium]